MRFLIASALLASAALATPAFAQDSTPAPVEGKEFQGFKVGAITGVDHVTYPGESATGLSYGGTVGYDYQSGNIVLGVEGEVSGATTKDCQTSVLVAGDKACLKAGRDLYAGARAGVVVGGKTLLYIKGGYDNGRLVNTYSTTGFSSKIGDNSDGWRVGGGAEINVSDKIFARAEYRYTNYSDSTLSRHQGLVGLGFKF